MAKVLEFQLQHHSLKRNPRADLLQNGLVGSPCSVKDSQESSPTPSSNNTREDSIHGHHQMVKHLPTMQETQLRFLGWEDLLEKEMATHSGTLAWKIPWTEESGGLQNMGLQRVGHD